MSTITLPTLDVLDLIEASFDEQRSAALARLGGADAERSAVLGSVLAQLKARMMGVLRSRCAAAGAWRGVAVRGARGGCGAGGEFALVCAAS